MPTTLAFALENSKTTLNGGPFRCGNFQSKARRLDSASRSPEEEQEQEQGSKAKRQLEVAVERVDMSSRQSPRPPDSSPFLLSGWSLPL